LATALAIQPLMAEFTRVGALSFGTTHVATVKDNLLVAASGNAVEIYDVSVPNHPAVLSRIDETGGGEIKTMDFAGDTLFLATTSGYVRAYDLSDPAYPRLIASRRFEDAVLGVRVKDTLVLLANGYFGLRILRRSDLSEITHMSGEYATGLDYVGDTVFLTAVSLPLKVIDVSDPTSPSVVSTSTLSGCEVGLYVKVFKDNFLAVRCADTLSIYDITDVDSLSHVATIPYYITTNPYFLGDTVFFAYLKDVKVYALDDPSSPTLAFDTSLAYPTLISYVVAKDSSMYVFTDYPRRAMYVLSSTVEELYLPGRATSMTKVGSFVFTYAHGLTASFVADPSRPSLLYYEPISMALPAVGYVDAYGPNLYVVGAYNLQKYDVSDPFSPELRLSTPLPFKPYCLDAIAPDTLLICGSSHLYLYDGALSDSIRMAAWDAAAAGDVAVVVSLYTLYVVGLSPFQILGSIPTPSNTRGAVTVDGNLAYFVQEDGDSLTLWVVDIGDPTSPVILSSVKIEALPLYWLYALPMGIYKASHYVFVSAVNVGIAVIDVSDPTSPRVVDKLPAEGYGVDILVDGGYIYYLDNISGLIVYRYPLATSVEERPKDVSSVPFRLEGRLLRASVPVRIYDFSGRLVGAGKMHRFTTPGVFFVVAEGETYRVVVR